MRDDTITEVGIDEHGRLYVCPATTSFPFIYRAAMEVNWDEEAQRLFGQTPRERTYIDWFKHIVAAAWDEYRVSLTLAVDTVFVNVSDDLRSEIQSVSQHR